eukprot:5023777-Lingulodinium_polyedra.AAC.1
MIGWRRNLGLRAACPVGQQPRARARPARRPKPKVSLPHCHGGEGGHLQGEGELWRDGEAEREPLGPRAAGRGWRLRPGSTGGLSALICLAL